MSLVILFNVFLNLKSFFSPDLSSNWPLLCLYNTHSFMTQENVRAANAPSNEKSTGNIFANLPQASGGFPALPGGDNVVNNKNRKTFGAPFGKSPSVIGPQNRPGPAIASLDPDVEVFSEVIIKKCGQGWGKV